MAGFSLKKKDDSSKKTTLGGFSLKKKEPLTAKKPLLKSFGKTEREDDEEQVVQVDTFDSKDGAYDKDTGPLSQSKPVISNPGNKDWRKITKDRFNPSQTNRAATTVAEEEGKKIVYGLNIVGGKGENTEQGGGDNTNANTQSGTGLLLQGKKEREAIQREREEEENEPTMEDYEAMPVEDFGAAMLRGMGWVDEDDEETKKKEKAKSELPIRPSKRRPGYLGLGATAPPDDGDDTEGKDYMPPFRLVKKTSRERSPTRDSQTYRERT